MLNRDGIRKKVHGAPKQILANVDLQASVGCLVPKSLGVDVGDGITLAKAGTPINVDFMNLQALANAVADGTPMNAVLLHDVDVSRGNANGTALYFGVVNVNCVESDVAKAITDAKSVDGASPLLVFGKF